MSKRGSPEGPDRFDISMMPRKRKRKTVVVRYRANDSECGDGVVCRICGASLSQIGSHLLWIHRMSVAEYREKHGQDAPVICERLLKSWIQTCKETGARRRKIIKCAMCGKAFVAIYHGRQGFRKKTCSRKCASLYLSSQRSGVPRYVYQAASNSHSPAREAWVEKLKARRIADRSRTCSVCGKSWVSSRPSKRVTADVCSIACRSVYRRRIYEQKLAVWERCERCGKQFAATNNHGKFCSRECYFKALAEEPRYGEMRRKAMAKVNARPEVQATRAATRQRAVAARSGTCELCGMPFVASRPIARLAWKVCASCRPVKKRAQGRINIGLVNDLRKSEAGASARGPAPAPKA